MKKIFYIFLIFLYFSVTPKPIELESRPLPTKVWIYFTDKPSISSLDVPDSSLVSECALSRRMNRGIIDNNNINNKPVNNRHILDLDIPVNEDYISRVMTSIENGHDRVKLRVKSKWLNAISVDIEDLSLADVERLERLEFVKSVEKVEKYRRREIIDSDSISNSDYEDSERGESYPRRDDSVINYNYGKTQKQLEQVGIPQLHKEGLTGKGVKILVIDAGFSTKHEVFKNINVSMTWDFTKNVEIVDNEKVKEISHGTRVLSLIGGKLDGSFYGGAFNGEFILAKTEVLYEEKEYEEDYFQAAIEWGESNGADMVSSSLGYTNWYEFQDYDGRKGIISRAINQATALGMTCVISAGNEGIRGISAPTDSFFVISVGAVDVNGNVASFSSRGPTADNRIKPEICARGSATVTVKPNSKNEYMSSSGTSFAAPIIASGVALMLEKDKNLTPEGIRRRLMLTASSSDNPNNNIGYGIANFYEASKLKIEDCCSISYPNPNPIEKGYLETCYDVYSPSCVDKYWICERDSERHTGPTCIGEEAFCDETNCNYTCVGHVCVEDTCEAISLGDNKIIDLSPLKGEVIWIDKIKRGLQSDLKTYKGVFSFFVPLLEDCRSTRSTGDEFFKMYTQGEENEEENCKMYGGVKECSIGEYDSPTKSVALTFKSNNENQNIVIKVRMFCDKYEEVANFYDCIFSEDDFSNTKTINCNAKSTYACPVNSVQHKCFGIHSYEGDVCGGKGFCIHDDTCKCEDKYYGISCEDFDCFGKKHNSNVVCNEKGTCIAPNTCVCKEYSFGKECYFNFSNFFIIACTIFFVGFVIFCLLFALIAMACRSFFCKIADYEKPEYDIKASEDIDEYIFEKEEKMLIN